MPDNECDEQFSHKLDISTHPLHVITQYPSSGTESMQSPGRPTTLGICSSNAQNLLDFRNASITFRTALSQDGSNQSWKLRAVDAVEFEKLVGQLGNNGSTPVTPTSFLNPKNVTEDQERFADNFSRTLNKVKAEQEGWAAAVAAAAASTANENVLDNTLGVASFDETALHSDRTDHFVGSNTYLNDENSSDNAIQEPSQSASSLVGIHLPASNSSRTNSPNLTDQSIMLLSSSPSNVSQSGLTPNRKTGHANVKSKSSTSSPFPQTYFSESLAADEIHATNGTPWTTGLPTILSIASGLKQTASLRNTINGDSPRPDETISHPLTLNPVISNGGSPPRPHHQLHQQHQLQNEPNDQEEQLIHSTVGLTKLPFDLSSLNEAERSHLLMRCANPDIPNSVQLLDSTSDNLLESLIPVTTNSRLPLRSDANHYAIRDTLTSLYGTSNAHVVNTDASSNGNSVQESAILQPILATTLSPSISSSPSVPLGVIGSSPTAATTSFGAVDNLVTIIGSQGRSLSVCLNTTDASHHIDGSTTDSQLLQGNHSALDRAHSVSVPLSPNTRLFNGSTAYTNTSNNFGISSDHGSRDDLIVQTNSVILSANQHFQGQLLSHHPPPLVGPHIDTQSFQTMSLKQLPSDIHLTQNFMCSSSDLQLSGSDTKSLSISGDGNEAAGLTGYPLTSTAGLSKRTKMTGTSIKRSRMLTLPRTSVADPGSVDRASDLLSEPKKGSMKRSRIDYARLQSFANGDFGSLMTSEPNNGLSNHSCYSSDQTRLYGLKQESLNPDDLDELSTPSESLSAGTGRTMCDNLNNGNNQLTSLDEVDQLNRKLERKRARNRVAARRCRERKLSLIQTLQHEVALKDAHVRSLEDMLARYRAEGELLKQHIESLAGSYPDLKAELYKFSFLFQHHAMSSTSGTDLINSPGMSKQSTPVKSEAPDNLNPKHFI